MTPRVYSYKAFGCRSALYLAIGVFLMPAALGQTAESENADKKPRKLVYKVEPQYPAELKRACIGGIVRLDVMISPRGLVQAVSIVGGNPVLAECGQGSQAMEMLESWDLYGAFTLPADAQTSVRLNVKFDPRH